MNVFPLFRHAILLLQGPDAFKFLQGQVTCDIQQLQITDGQGKYLFGAHCNHRGRMLFNFSAIATSSEAIALKLPESMIEIAHSALVKYIAFSKAEAFDVKEQYQLYGITIENLDEFNSLPCQLPQIDNQTSVFGSSTIIRRDDQHYELWLHQDEQHMLGLDLVPSDQDEYWQQWLLQQKIPDIFPEISGVFTPHAIGFQDVGVNFKKGCYIGQEVVARMHYLGKTKRQLLLLRTETLDVKPELKQAIYRSSDNKNVGEVINVGIFKNDVLILAAVNIDTEDNDPLQLGKKQSPLTVLT